MSTLEQRTIADIQNLVAQGYLSPYDGQWCIGAIRNRHGLTRETRHQLRDLVQAKLRSAKDRALGDIEASLD